MAQLFYTYSTMSAGKSLDLLKVNHNYREQGKKTLLFTPRIDTRHGEGKITSRIGIQEDALSVDYEFNFYEYVKRNKIVSEKVYCILIDEAQFLSREQIVQLSRVVDWLGIPVMCYGLKNDFQNNLFEGSEALLLYADKIIEIKTICAKEECGKKAIMNGRFIDGIIETEGAQVVIGDEQYIPLCRKCYMGEVKNRDAKKENG